MVVHAPLGRAVLAGLLVLVGLGSVVATDLASTEDNLTIPAIHVGDEGTYVATLQYPDGTPTATRAGHWTNMTFAWRQGAARSDLDGVVHQARVLETFTRATPGAGWTGSWARWSIDAASGETVAVDLKWYSMGSSLVSVNSGTWTTVGNTTRFNQDTSLCGMRSSLLGHSGAPPEQILVEGGCSDQASRGPSGRTQFRLDGTDTIAGHRAYRYAPTDGGPVRVWYASGLAAPIQVLQPSVADGEVRDLMQRLTLVGWQPGSEAETLPDVATTSPGAPLEWAPRDRWGPVPGELDHPFPHTKAWDLAMRDPTSGLSEFIDGHPNAYLSLLHGSKGLRNGLQAFTWIFIVTDGLEALGFTVSASESPTPLVALPDAVRYDIGTYATETSPLWLVDPDQVPDTLFPTFGSMLDRWSLLRGRDAPEAPVYGFGVWCQTTGCGEVSSWAFAGESTSELRINSTSNQATWDQLHVSLPSRAATLTYQSTQTQVGALRGAATLGPGTDFDSPPAGAATLATRWIASPAGAGTFAAALLVAVLTYLWPTLKQGALGLFSRLSPDALAGHPTRQAILDAVAASPGIHFQALCRTLGKGRGVVGHHLAKLVAAGHVTQHRKGGFTCYFLKSQGAAATAGLAAVTALKAEGAQVLLQQVASTPDRSGLELAQVTGLSPSTVHYHLKRLQDAGLVLATPRGRSIAMRLTVAGERAANGAPSATASGSSDQAGNLA